LLRCVSLLLHETVMPTHSQQVRYEGGERT
jgi:hypothetical protein